MHALCAHRLAATAAARDAGARAMAARLRRAGPGATVSVKETAYEFVVNAIMTTVAGERMPEEQVLRFKEMTEARFVAAGAANQHGWSGAAPQPSSAANEEGEKDGGGGVAAVARWCLLEDFCGWLSCGRASRNGILWAIVSPATCWWR